MAALLYVLRQGFAYLGFSLQDLWRVAKEWLGTKWALILLGALLIFLVITNAVQIGLFLVTLLAELVINNFNLSPPAGIGTALNIANTFFPLVEMFGMIVAYVAVVGVMTVYRFVKSMIPSPVPGGGGT